MSCCPAFSERSSVVWSTAHDSTMATEPSHFLMSKLVRIVAGQWLRTSNCHGKCKQACLRCLSLLARPNYTKAFFSRFAKTGPTPCKLRLQCCKGRKVTCYKDVQSSSWLPHIAASSDWTNQLRCNPSLSDIFAKEKCGGTDPLGSLRTLWLYEFYIIRLHTIFHACEARRFANHLFTASQGGIKWWSYHHHIRF